MSKHTPGPWETHGSFNVVVIRAGRTRTVATAGGYQDGDPSTFEVNCANARLIAAAPEMLEALKFAAQFIENGVELGYIRLPTEPDPALTTLLTIRTAIAKAEGRS